MFDSPHKNPSVQTAPTEVFLDKVRHNVIRDLDETVPEIPITFFFDNLLPPNPLPVNKTVADVVSSLSRKNKLVEGTWEGWKRPSAETDREDTVFSKFADLTDTIREASGIKDKHTTIEFKCNPAFTLTSTTRNNSSKPDCYGIRTDARLEVDGQTRKVQPLWLDVAIPGEFKKKSDEKGGNFCDNAAKVLWSMNHLMREDARRRFVIGFTIEDVNMRLWYCSRSDVFVSETFDWQKDHGKFVDFILRTSFADLDALGWDPSMTLLGPYREGKPVQYDIVVRDQKTTAERTFRTKRMISSIAADTLRGRGTRVWEVMELDSRGKEKGGSTCVLKDVWVDDNREREGDILEAIKKSTEEKSDPKEWLNGLKTLFLTTVMHGDVHVNSRVDKTRQWALPLVLDLLPLKNDPEEDTKGKGHLTPVGGMGMKSGSRQPAMQYFTTKCHHRIVFKEVGKTIREVKSLREAFTYIQQAVLALCVLHELGWVHRDISSGNILIVDRRVKLSDLEYAKHKGDFTVHGIRTGTIYFMSVEVEQHEYLYRKSKKTARSARIDSMAVVRDLNKLHIAQASTSADATKTLAQQPQPPNIVAPQQPRTDHNTPFRYNPLHDLESLYWLALYLLFSGGLVQIGAGNEGTEITPAHKEAQQELAGTLFCDLAFRMTVMRPGVLGSHLTNLHPHVAEIVTLLDDVRSELVEAFEESEESLEKPIPFSVAQNTYGGMTAAFQKIDEFLAAQDILVAVDEVSKLSVLSERAQDVTPEMPQDNAGVPPTKKPRAKNVVLPSSPRQPILGQLRRSKRLASSSKRVATAPK